MGSLAQMISFNNAALLLTDTANLAAGQDQSNAFFLELIKAQATQADQVLDPPAGSQVAFAPDEFSRWDLDGDFTLSTDEMQAVLQATQSQITDLFLTGAVNPAPVRATPDIDTLFALGTYSQVAALGSEFESADTPTKKALLSTLAPNPFGRDDDDDDTGDLFASVGDWLSGGRFGTTA